MDMIAEGGAHLADHLERRSVDQIARQFRPDIVVLQDFSTVALNPQTAQRSHRAIRAFCKLAGSSRLVLLATWPRAEGRKLYRQPDMPRTPAEMTSVVQAHYGAATCIDRPGLQVAPVGQAWMLGTGLPLHRGDGYHASLTGAWLSALVLARSMRLAPDRPHAPAGVEAPRRLIRIARAVAP